MATGVCPGSINIAAISGFYAQLTGVLAGFALTAIVLLLAPLDSVADKKKRALSALFAAFAALVISTLLYSIIGGDSDPASYPRSATESLVNGVPFGTAAMMLFQGLAVLLDSVKIDHTAVWCARAMAVVIAPTITLYYLTTGASITQAIRGNLAPGRCLSSEPFPLGIALSAGLAVILTLMLWIAERHPSRLPSAQSLRQKNVVAVLVVSVAAAVVGGYLNTRGPSFIMSSIALNLYMIGVSLILLSISVVLILEYAEDVSE